jgi:hypothetical protein
MSALAAACSLLAEIGDNFPDSGKRLTWSDLWPYGIAAVVAAIAVFAYVQIRKRNDMTLRCDDPQRLFRELCRAHKLGRGSARLLSQLATASQLAQPAQIFLTPAAFDAKSLPASLRPRAAEFKRLQKELF